MSSTTESRVTDLVAPMAEARGLVVFDVDHSGGVLRVFLDTPPDVGDGVDLDVLAEVTRELSRALDEADPISGRYTLEVSSPGLERKLRTPEHFRWAEGRAVAIRRVPGVEGDRRLAGTVTYAGDDSLTLLLDDSGGEVDVPYCDIERARTTFEWGGAPKPGGKAGKGGKGGKGGTKGKGASGGKAGGTSAGAARGGDRPANTTAPGATKAGG